MSLSYFMQVGLFKSPLKVVAAFLLRSRETQTQRAAERTGEINKLNRLIEQQTRTIAQAEQELAAANLLIVKLKIENQHLREQPPALPDDPPLPQHQFGPKMIALCVNLARTIGLRASVIGLKIVLDWLQVNVTLPHWTT